MSEPTGLLGTLIERIIQRVAELPDRTSPDDWPEAMMVTPAELRVIVAEEFEAGALPPAPPQEQEPMKLRSASESVGWLNSEGPLAVSPNLDLAASPPAQEQEPVNMLMPYSAEDVVARLRAIRDRLQQSTPEPLTRNRYEHGGGRMFRDGEAGARILVVDCYDAGDREFYFHAREDIGYLAQLVADLVDQMRVAVAPPALVPTEPPT